MIWLTVNCAAYSSISMLLLFGIDDFSSYFWCSASMPSFVAIKWEYNPDWYIMYCNLFYCFFAYCSYSSLFFNYASSFYFFFLTSVSSFSLFLQYIRHYLWSFFALRTLSFWIFILFKYFFSTSFMHKYANFLHWASLYCFCLMNCLDNLKIYLLLSRKSSFNGSSGRTYPLYGVLFSKQFTPSS